MRLLADTAAITYALIPDNGPPRVVRFVRSGVLPAGTLAMLDTKRKLLLVNHMRYLRLSPLERHALICTNKVEIKMSPDLPSVLFPGGGL